MPFQEAIRTVLQRKYATFGGRARRSEFWWFALFSAVVGAVANLLDQLIFGSVDRVFGVVNTTLTPIGGIVNLLLLVPSIAVGARRLHDTDRSGWRQLLVLIPLVGIILLIVWWAQDSKPGANEHGPSPKQLTAPAM